ncbi:MAG TPA: MBL fold metallo-hydrolase [Deltaproteobacteria bacterium]|nr:MBL fold metallo-hydrolase [Deltaproteobacteria bacterium]
MLVVEQIESSGFSLLSYVIRDEDARECIVVDPPQDISSRIDLSPLTVNAVVNTHTHPDHTLGNHLFRGRAPILAHARENFLPLRIFNSTFSLILTRRIQPAISFSLEEGDHVQVGEYSLQVMHTPGHSPGSICLSWEGNLITGDLLFADGIGRTDIPGGSAQRIKESLARTATLPDETLLWPGHSYGGKTRATLGDVRPLIAWALKNL